MVAVAAQVSMDQQLWQRVEAMDLAPICARMQSPGYELPQWPDDLLATLTLLYRRFFYLLCRYPDEGLVPTKEIDEIWHNHILFTKRYHRDCQAIAGRYLHHTPDDPDCPNDELMQHGFERTKARYKQTFGEALLVFV